MTALDLFERLAPLVGPALEAEWKRRDLCILATRIVLDVAEYFSVEAQPLPVRALVYNEAYGRHVDAGDELDAKELAALDGSWSVGLGFGLSADTPEQLIALRKWAGHLIVAAGDLFGDFSIRQAEREQHGILTGNAVVGYLPPKEYWGFVNDLSGTQIDYQRIGDVDYRTAPDWRDRARRKRIVGSLIRQVREARCA